jgi:uncharacterized membrane-anchored protein
VKIKIKKILKIISMKMGPTTADLEAMVLEVVVVVLVVLVVVVPVVVIRVTTPLIMN